MKSNPARVRFKPAIGLLVVCLLTLILPARAGSRFTVATYNLENYLLAPVGTRPAKPETSRSKIIEILLAAKPDVLALQEIGETNCLLELQSSLAARGLRLNHMEHVRGYDTGIFVAVLSRFPMVSRKSHTNEAFLLDGRRFRTSRGFAEVDIQVTSRYTFTLLTGHLKSRRTVADADEAQIRAGEATRLRHVVDDVFRRRSARADLLVCGDFNDHRDSPALRTIVGEANLGLVDTRPSEKNGDTAPAVNPRWDARRITWTHYYAREDTYSRFDYILISRGMAREWKREESYVAAVPDWGLASDHRPVIAVFETPD